MRLLGPNAQLATKDDVMQTYGRYDNHRTMKLRMFIGKERGALHEVQGIHPDYVWMNA